MEWWLDVLRSAETREPTVKIAPLCLLPLLLVACATAESPRPPPTSDADPAWWKQQGEIALRKARSWSPGTPERARNVILFVGDGMGVSTVTAARILEGQLRGERGEENVLSFEELPPPRIIQNLYGEPAGLGLGAHHERDHDGGENP